MRSILLVLLVIATATAGAAELKGIKGTDDRVIVSASEYPWSTVGRVNNGQGGYCSGVLIGPKLALTAAHCLWNKHTRRPMPASALHFVAGWERGEFLGATEVVRTVVAPDWRFGENYDPAHAAHDWALLELSAPLGETAGWLGLADGRDATKTVTTVGYAQDHKHVPTAHIGCHITGTLANGLLIHDCDAVHGDSGAPVIVRHLGTPLVAAIHVATLSRDGRVVGGAVDVARLRAEAIRMGAKTPGRAGPQSHASNHRAGP